MTVCFHSISLPSALKLLLALTILLQIVTLSPVEAKVVPYGESQHVIGQSGHDSVLDRPSHRLRMERPAIRALDTVSTLSTLASEITPVADHTSSASPHRPSTLYTRTVVQEHPSASLSVTLAPQESEVAFWPSHVRLGSAQKDFVSWSGSGGLLALGILGTIALVAALALRIHIASHLFFILVTCLVLMIGTSIDLSMGVSYSHNEVRSYGRCICSALAYAEATWATYVWIYLVVFHNSTAQWLSHPSGQISLIGNQTQDQHPEFVRTTRMISVVFTFLIGLFEVCWRVTLVREYWIGWHLQQASIMLQFIFSLVVGLPLARSCSYEWVECHQVRDVCHWLATSGLFVGWAVGTGRLAAAFRVLGFCESPLGRLLWLLQLVCFTITAISLNVMETRYGDRQAGELKGVIVEKPLPRVPSESHDGRRLTNRTLVLSERRGSGPVEAMQAASGLTDGQQQDPALMRTPRRKQPLVEGANVFPVPPSTPAGVPSSVYLPVETPSMYLDSMRAEYLALGPRERAISLPLNRLPATPSSHGGGLSLSNFGINVPTPNASSAKLSHRGRSSSLGDVLTRRTSHDTFMAMKRRYEGRAQAEKHRRARSASSDMTHLTVTSFFNQFPAPPPMLPIPFHLTQHVPGQSGTTISKQASRPSSISKRGAESPTRSRSRASKPFTTSKLAHTVLGDGTMDAVSSCSSGTDNNMEGHAHYTPHGDLSQEDYRLRVNSLLSMEGIALTNDGKAGSVRPKTHSRSADKAEVQRKSATSVAKPRWPRRMAKDQKAPATVPNTSGSRSIITDRVGIAIDMCPFPTGQGDLYAFCGAERGAARSTRDSKGRSVTFSIEEEGGEAAGRM